MSSSIKTLAEVAATAPGGFISGGFQAVVTNPKAIVSKKSGKTFYKATLTEGSTKVDATSFTTDFTPCAGKLMKWLGMGISRGDDYNGTAQVTIGDKARWIPVGDGPAASSPVDSPAPAAPQGANATNSKPSGRPEGVTVGMAINNACNLAANRGDTNMDTVYQIASDLIRLSAKLQAGELAPESPANDQDVPY